MDRHTYNGNVSASSDRAAARLGISPEQIKRLCRKWQIAELSLYGSVLRDDFRPDSDVDVLVTFLPDAHVGWRELAGVEEDLARALGRRVDVTTRRAIERSENYILRKNVL
ncbi:MAG TPA: nucleotidyltransferase domain-containing protein, partial [Chloroflexota bacterium]|nr:nucleotidyltransferase domain-containing protein [Chloroflexota bacterium]